MFGFGDDFSIEIQQVPWLFWANLLVMLLLLFLIYHFVTILGFEGADTAASVPAQKAKEYSSRAYSGSSSITRKICPEKLIKVWR